MPARSVSPGTLDQKTPLPGSGSFSSDDSRSSEKWAFAAFRDYQRQEALGRDPIFVADGNTDLPGELPANVWTAENGRTFEADYAGT